MKKRFLLETKLRGLENILHIIRLQRLIREAQGSQATLPHRGFIIVPDESLKI